MKKFHILGDINRRDEVNISPKKSIKEILNQDAEGMLSAKRVKLVQLGGPLGVFIRGKELNNPIEDYLNVMDTNTILYLNDIMCPVDLLRFCVRYIIREVQINDEDITAIHDIVENISKGESSLEDYTALKKIAEQDTDTYVKKALYRATNYLTSEFENEFMEHIINKKCASGICRRLADAQCVNACPAEIFIPGYVALMTEDRIEEAYSLMRKSNPLSLVCGIVCPAPCEARCRRGEIEKTVGVRALKRFAGDMSLKTGEFKEDKLADKDKKVAIIGAGPAGLTAAYYLGRSGYQVSVYEAQKEVGGMLAVGIPSYRLPQEHINKEVQLIKNLGVSIFTDIKIGKDITLEDIRESNDAVFLATGCHVGNKFGPESENIEAAIDFLREVRADGRTQVGKNVLVIGGGDVAMDAARTAVRMGANKVFLASLETRDIMPAGEEEIHGALEEGVKFINGYGSKGLNIQEGKLKGITLKKCASVFDDEYKFSPEYDEEEIKYLETDHLILAIGQKSDNSYLDQDIKLNNRGWVEIDPFSYETSAKGVFAAGDMYKPGIAIKAISEGAKAAEAIDKYLAGNGIYRGAEIEIPEPQLSYALWDTDKVEDKIRPAVERKNNFEEIGCTFSAVEAKLEAQRCMRCDRNSKQ